LEGAGWSFRRVLSPGLFADAERAVTEIAAAAAAGADPAGGGHHRPRAAG
jgi:hypothetical protein